MHQEVKNITNKQTKVATAKKFKTKKGKRNLSPLGNF